MKRAREPVSDDEAAATELQSQESEGAESQESEGVESETPTEETEVPRVAYEEEPRILLLLPLQSSGYVECLNLTTPSAPFVVVLEDIASTGPVVPLTAPPQPSASHVATWSCTCRIIDWDAEESQEVIDERDEREGDILHWQFKGWLSQAEVDAALSMIGPTHGF